MTPVDVLAVAAHPDDAEVGCGGVLALAVRDGRSAAILDLTRGELSTSGTVESRAEEAGRAAAVLGVERHSLGLPDGDVGVAPDHTDAVIDALRTFRPRVVLAPYALEDRHPDHAAAGRLVRRASFLAGVAKRGSGPVHRSVRIYHYQLHHAFTPSLVVDVTPVWDTRTAAIDAYASQFHQYEATRTTAIGGADFRGVLAARARALGALVGVTYGEAYYCEGPVGVRALPDLDDTAPDPDLRTYRAFL